MKDPFKRFGLLGLFLLLVFGVFSFVNGEQNLISTVPLFPEHILRLHSSYLWTGVNDNNPSWLRVSTGSHNLDVLNGLIVLGNLSTLDNVLNLVVIGGGDSNGIYGSYAGIAGGSENTVRGDYSAIGGGQNNNVTGENSVVVGGYQNKALDGGVVVGGYSNNGNVGVALGGFRNNKSGKNSLIMGSNSNGNSKEGFFSWNGTGNNRDSARINAESGVLVGTFNPIDGVDLVVDGPVKIGDDYTSSLNKRGKMVDSGGCIIVDDSDSTSRTLGEVSETPDECGAPKGVCYFGKAVLQDGDVVTGYLNEYSINCESHVVSCNNGSLSPATYKYPNCYEISDNPFFDE